MQEVPLVYYYKLIRKKLAYILHCLQDLQHNVIQPHLFNSRDGKKKKSLDKLTGETGWLIFKDACQIVLPFSAIWSAKFLEFKLETLV